MIKLSELFNEIKVNNPNKFFQVTDKGRQVYKEFDLLNKLVDKFSSDLTNDKVMDAFHNDGKYIEALNFTIFVDEKIISLNKPTSIDDFIDGCINKLGNAYDESDAKMQLKKLIKSGYITPIKLD